MMRILCGLPLLTCACLGDTIDRSHPGTADPGKADGVGAIIDQGDRDDITVIRAQPSGIQVHGSVVNQCEVIEIVSAGLVRMDCTDAIDSLIADQLSETGLLAHRFTTFAHENEDGSYSPSSSGIPCGLTRVVTATRSAALEDMLRIGFHFSGSSRPVRLIEPAQLTAVDERMGLDGQPRTIHELHAALPCWQGTGSSSYHARYEFKPFIDFAGADGNIYRNWDVVPHDYVLTGGAGATEFDRTGEVLQD